MTSKGLISITNEDIRADETTGSQKAFLLSKRIAIISCLLIVVLLTVSSRTKSYPSSSLLGRHLEVTSLVRDDNAPGIALMLGFPYSGQTFIQRAIHQMTETSTATNYGSSMMRFEDGIVTPSTRNSIPVYEGFENGPFVFSDTLPLPHKGYILTRSFGAAFCKRCLADQYIRKDRVFFVESISGERLINGLEKSVRYSAGLVDKYIHIIRNPMSHIAARYVHERDVYEAAGKSHKLVKFSNDIGGLKRHCKKYDNEWFGGSNFRAEKEEVFKDVGMQKLAEEIPCRSDFFRYVQWHNNAFASAQEKFKEKPVLVVYYENLMSHQHQQMSEILKFLELEKLQNAKISSKWYELADNPPYFTDEDVTNIKEFIHELSSPETWEHIKEYFP